MGAAAAEVDDAGAQGLALQVLETNQIGLAEKCPKPSVTRPSDYLLAPVGVLGLTAGELVRVVGNQLVQDGVRQGPDDQHGASHQVCG